MTGFNVVMERSGSKSTTTTLPEAWGRRRQDKEAKDLLLLERSICIAVAFVVFFDFDRRRESVW
jgi:hypothetical protein